ncbi:MAG: polysaccharide biosynthesis/export family protein [Verrucomicrobiota bacterium]|nr:polysaccharide biosynthesis/export family protein [Verrucomicrobiota bacterium]
MRLILMILLFGQMRFVSAQEGTAAYQLAPMDKLSILIQEDPAPGKATELSVSALGDIVVPISRCCEESINLNVRGKTVEQVQKELTAELEKQYYAKATVQLKLVDPNRKKGQALFRGAVRGNIVQLEQGSRKTLWEALTEVGTTEFADLRKVKLDRVDPSTGQNSITYHDMEAVNKGARDKDVELKDGDRITVKEKFFNWR